MSPDGTVPTGKPWYQSDGVRVAIGSLGFVFAGWLVVSAGRHAFDWWALLSGEAGILVILFDQLRRPDVVAPLDLLNTNNPRKVP